MERRRGGGRRTGRVEIRTVNHRHFNPSLKLSGDLIPLEAELRERLRKDFDRGHVSVSARWTEAPERDTSLTVDLERARAVAAQFRALQQALEIPGEVDLAMIVRQPDVVTGTAERMKPTVAWSELEPVVAQAIAECKAMRRGKGPCWPMSCDIVSPARAVESR